MASDDLARLLRVPVRLAALLAGASERDLEFVARRMIPPLDTPCKQGG